MGTDFDKKAILVLAAAQIAAARIINDQTVTNANCIHGGDTPQLINPKTQEYLRDAFKHVLALYEEN